MAIGIKNGIDFGDRTRKKNEQQQFRLNTGQRPVDAFRSALTRLGSQGGSHTPEHRAQQAKVAGGAAGTPSPASTTKRRLILPPDTSTTKIPLILPPAPSTTKIPLILPPGVSKPPTIPEQPTTTTPTPTPEKRVSPEDLARDAIRRESERRAQQSREILGRRLGVRGIQTSGIALAFERGLEADISRQLANELRVVDIDELTSIREAQSDAAFAQGQAGVELSPEQLANLDPISLAKYEAGRAGATKEEADRQARIKESLALGALAQLDPQSPGFVEKMASIAQVLGIDVGELTGLETAFEGPPSVGTFASSPGKNNTIRRWHNSRQGRRIATQ